MRPNSLAEKSPEVAAILDVHPICDSSCFVSSNSCSLAALIAQDDDNNDEDEKTRAEFNPIRPKFQNSDAELIADSHSSFHAFLLSHFIRFSGFFFSSATSLSSLSRMTSAPQCGKAKRKSKNEKNRSSFATLPAVDLDCCDVRFAFD